MFDLKYLLDLLFPPRDTHMLVRAATAEALREHFAPHVTQVGDSSAISLLPYHVPLVQALITEAKYENNKKAQQLLGELLRYYIKVCMKNELNGSNTVLTPIPLGSKRRKERGYNQTEEMARFTQQTTDLLVRSEALVRIRDTEPQTSLGRAARLNNMQGAFVVPTSAQPLDPSISYILFDDVLTTGATIFAAREALINAGAKHVRLLTLAH